MSFIYVLVAIVAAAFLIRMLYRRLGTRSIGEFNEQRRAEARLVTPGEYVDGNRRMPVAMALTPSTLFYENSDMAATLDLQFVREIDYDSALGTGGDVPGSKVLRLRSGSQTFEFVIADEHVPRWHMHLPPRRANKLEFSRGAAV